MTSKTIDGVSRELLENLLHCGSTSSFITPATTAQLRALLAHPIVRVDERAKFEKWLRDRPHVVNLGFNKQTGKYLLQEDEDSWQAWQARALLAAPEAPRQEPVAPHVVGYMPDSPDGDPLITLESHQAYVGGLCTKIKALCNHPSMSFHQIALLEGLLPLDDEACKTGTAPLSPDLIHDLAYRNGLMAGFQFGIIGNEKGYATAINKFNTEIHAAKADPLSPDHSGGGAGVVLPEGWKAVPIEPTELMVRRGDQNYSWSVAKIYKAMIEDAPSLDKVKELNQ